MPCTLCDHDGCSATRHRVWDSWCAAAIGVRCSVCKAPAANASLLRVLDKDLAHAHTQLHYVGDVRCCNGEQCSWVLAQHLLP